MGKALYGELLAGGHQPSMKMARLAGVLVGQREVIAEYDAKERMIADAAKKLTETTAQLEQSPASRELVDA